MDANLIFAKTPQGNRALRQNDGIVQRHLRMVLVLVDGKLTVRQLADKVGNQQLVLMSLKALEAEGYILPVDQAEAVSGQADEADESVAPTPAELRDSNFELSGLSEFSTFEPKAVAEKAVAAEVEAKAPEMDAEPIVDDGVDPAKRPFEWRMKHAVGGVLGVFGLVFATLFVYPFLQDNQAVAARLAKRLNQPVTIAGIGSELAPTPAMRLSGVRVNNGMPFDVRVPLTTGVLFSGIEGAGRLEVVGGQLPADQLVTLGQVADGLRRIALHNAAFAFGGLALPGVSGTLEFEAGRLQGGALETADQGLRLRILPAEAGRLLFSLEGFGWHPVGDSPVIFNSMQAKGMVEAGRLVLHEVDTTLMGGVAKGEFMIDWRSGVPVMAGNGVFSRLDGKRLFAWLAPQAEIEGEMSGYLKFRTEGADAATARQRLSAAVELSVERGAWLSVDIGEAARQAGRQSVQSGSTRFNKLKSDINISAQNVDIKVKEMNAGALSATGKISVDAQRQLQGEMLVSLTGAVNSVQVPVKLSGALKSVTATATGKWR